LLASLRDLASDRPVQLDVLVGEPRLQSRRRQGLSHTVRCGEEHGSGTVRRRVPSVAERMSFRDIEKSFFDLHWQLGPVAATQAGVPGHDDHYGRFSPAALAPHLAALKSIASALEGVNAA